MYVIYYSLLKLTEAYWCDKIEMFLNLFTSVIKAAEIFNKTTPEELWTTQKWIQ